MTEDYRYDVALSFASEQRWYVEVVARALRDFGVTVFYDEFESARLWGQDGIETFSATYSGEAYRVVMFISDAYVNKGWPTIERRAALSRLLSEPASNHILPVRFDDDVEVPGLPPQTIFQRADDQTPAQLAELIVDHLIERGRLAPEAKMRPGAAIERARLVAFTSMADSVDGTAAWNISYRIANGSPSPIDGVVVAVPDPGLDSDASADDQRGCAIEMVVGVVGPGQVVEDDLQVELAYEPHFVELPYVATLIWTDADDNHWAACGTDLRRRTSRARTC